MLSQAARAGTPPSCAPGAALRPASLAARQPLTSNTLGLRKRVGSMTRAQAAGSSGDGGKPAAPAALFTIREAGPQQPDAGQASVVFMTLVLLTMP